MREANRIAELLVSGSLAACVQVTPISSTYRWKSKVQRAKEFLLIIKTRKELYDKVERAIKRVHSYELPEIVAQDITSGSKDYLDWLSDNTKR